MHGRLMLTLVLTLAAWGCQDQNKAANLPRPTPTWQSDQPASRKTVYAAPDRAGAPTEVVQTTEDPKAVYTVDAMVGQINGRPLYASEVFSEIGEQTLQTMAGAKPKPEFVRDLYTLLRDTLAQKVTDALVLAEAESSLTEQEQMGLLEVLRKYREDLIAKSLGSEARTEQRLRQERDQSLEQAVEEQRQRILVSKYMQDKLYPYIHITRYDVERYYEEHGDQFNPDAVVTVMIIVARNPRDADEVAAALEAGKSFEEAGAVSGARLRTIEYRGKMDEFKALAWDEVNEKAQQLGEGEHTDRVDVSIGSIWVMVADIESGEHVPLSDVYLKIEQQLRAQKFDQLNRKYMAELLRKGNYTPLDQMLEVLVEVAVNRYAGA